MPLDLSDMPAHSPLKIAMLNSPLRHFRSAPANLASIPSGEQLTDSSAPRLERQSTPQAIHAR